MSDSLKVLQLGPYPPPHGGVESNLVAIRRFLRRQGIPCAVINITRHRKQEKEDVYYPENSWGVFRLLRRLQYDVIHLQVGGTLSNRVLALGLLCTLQAKSKSVMTFHSGGFPSTDEGKAMQRNSFAGFVLRRFDGLIGVNEEIMSFFARLGAAPRRMRLILPHSFLEEDHPAEMPDDLGSFFCTHSPVLISVGGLEPEYDVPLQIEALGPVRAQFPAAGLVVIGSGSLEAEMKKRIAASGCADHIKLCGDVPHAVTLQAIARSALMLRTTHYDGDAISVREALHLGTPVIASDNGMRPAGVHLVPKSNLQALVSAIGERLSQPAATKTAYEAEEQNLQAVLDFYRELTSGRTASVVRQSESNRD